MEDFEEMKLYWNQLAEKNNVDSETNKKMLESIMSNRYKSLTGKMIKERVICMIVAAVFMIFLLLYQKEKRMSILFRPSTPRRAAKGDGMFSLFCIKKLLIVCLNYTKLSM